MDQEASSTSPTETRHESVDVVKIPPHSDWKSFVSQYLEQLADGKDEYMYRKISRERVSRVRARGTDRNAGSTTYYPDQREAMKAMGIGPADYVHLFPDLRVELGQDDALVVYDKTQLKRVPKGAHMYVPQEGFTLKDSLVAIFALDKG